MKKVTVQTETSNYPIYVRTGLFSENERLAEELQSRLVGSRVCIVTNATVRSIYGELVEAFFEGFDVSFFEIEDGEQYKDFYGMSSTKAQQTYYGDLALHRAPEGKKVRLKYKGPIDQTVQSILGGMRSACSYVGAKKLKDLPKNCLAISGT